MKLSPIKYLIEVNRYSRITENDGFRRLLPTTSILLEKQMLFLHPLGEYHLNRVK